MSVLDYTGQQVLSDVTGISGGSPDTGEMRRKYNFAEKFTELSIDQTPFFRLVSKIGKKPTDDPQFKFTEKRQSWMKRYAYPVMASAVDDEAVGTSVGVYDGQLEPTDLNLFMATDYLSHGNIQNIIGQDGAAIGSAGTRPEFYLPHQVIKINYVPAANNIGGASDNYALFKIDGAASDIVAGYLFNAVDDGELGGENEANSVVGGFLAATSVGAGYATASYEEVTKITGTWVKAPPAGSFLTTYSAANYAGFYEDASPNGAYDNSIAEVLEPRRSYVTGTAYGEGSTLMQANWADQPYSTGYGLTQIFRTEFGMTNTARATALKYEANEWARLWRDKLIEHKWEIEQTALFGSQGTVSDVNYTQGAVDYILGNGNLFGWTTDKSQDDFLNDLSQLVDPRYNNSKKMMFFCSTEVYNWLYKLADGYFAANMGVGGDKGRWDFAVKGGKNAFGIDFSTVYTPYGDINMARCIALDNSNVKIMGVNMDYVRWRPLVGNGVNRDTSIYVGVQTLANTGTDKRVDMILTEGGFEWKMPECHAIWK